MHVIQVHPATLKNQFHFSNLYIIMHPTSSSFLHVYHGLATDAIPDSRPAVKIADLRFSKQTCGYSAVTDRGRR